MSLLNEAELVDHFDKGQHWLNDLKKELFTNQELFREAKVSLSDFVRNYYIVNYCDTHNKEFVSEEGVFYFVHYGYVQGQLQKLSVMRWEDIPQVLYLALHTPVVCHPFHTTIGAITESYCPQALKDVPHKEEVVRSHDTYKCLITWKAAVKQQYPNAVIKKDDGEGGQYRAVNPTPIGNQEVGQYYILPPSYGFIL
jgi:hypothetical protein